MYLKTHQITAVLYCNSGAGATTLTNRNLLINNIFNIKYHKTESVSAFGVSLI